MHPKAQAELANLFVNKILDPTGNRRSQILIETHSEHLIRRLQSAITAPNNPLTADHVAIYYVNMQSDGVSDVTMMELTENGQFKQKWPSGFFDQSFLLSKAAFSLRISVSSPCNSV